MNNAHRVIFLALSLLSGCASSPGVGPAAMAAKIGLTTLEAAAEVRRYVCSRALDPLLGDPRTSDPAVVPVPARPPVAADAGAPADAGP